MARWNSRKPWVISMGRRRIPDSEARTPGTAALFRFCSTLELSVGRLCKVFTGTEREAEEGGLAGHAPISFPLALCEDSIALAGRFLQAPPVEDRDLPIV